MTSLARTRTPRRGSDSKSRINDQVASTTCLASLLRNRNVDTAVLSIGS